MSQLDDYIKAIVSEENVDPTFLLDCILSGKAVILGRESFTLKPVAFGLGLRAKIGANIGLCPLNQNIDVELNKAREAIKSGADTIMDLSIIGNIPTLQDSLIRELGVPICSNPLYEAAVKSGYTFDAKSQPIQYGLLIEVIESQARRGLSSMTLHCSLTKEVLYYLERRDRVICVASRGGAIIASLMQNSGLENPLFEHFGEILSILRSEKVCLTLGSGTRSGTVTDQFGEAQVKELEVMKILVARSRDAGVPVRVEAPIGHVAFDYIPIAVKTSKALCLESPIGALGPLVTDIGLGFDHISASIGIANAVSAGLDFVSVISRKEHIGIPSADDIVEAVIAAKIATHAGDLVRLNRRREYLDRRMGIERASGSCIGQIEASLCPEEARRLLGETQNVCSLCGNYCPLKFILKGTGA